MQPKNYRMCLCLLYYTLVVCRGTISSVHGTDPMITDNSVITEGNHSIQTTITAVTDKSVVSEEYQCVHSSLTSGVMAGVLGEERELSTDLRMAIALYSLFIKDSEEYGRVIIYSTNYSWVAESLVNLVSESLGLYHVSDISGTYEPNISSIFTHTYRKHTSGGSRKLRYRFFSLIT